jgi:integrase
MARPKRSDTFSDSNVEALQPKICDDPESKNFGKPIRHEEIIPNLPGLRVVVQPSGAKSFVVRYSHAGQYRKLTLGAWPNLRFEPDAVRLYREAMTKKATGADPALDFADRKEADAAKRQQPAEDVSKFTFKIQFESFLNRPHKKTGKPKRASSRKRYQGIIAPLAAKWNERDVRTIGKDECEDAINESAKRGPHAQAGLWMLLNGFFAWMEKRETIQKSPMKTFDRVSADSNRKRTLADDELKTVWLACDQLGAFGRFIRMSMLTGQRRTEVASMRRSAVNFIEKYWEIPGDKAKNEMPHVIFLSDASMAIIEASPQIADCDFVFTNGGKKHVKGFSKGKIALDKLALIPHWTLNDLRRTLSTRFAKEEIVSLVVAEKVLNHGKGVLGGVAGDYNKWEYAPERRKAMDDWAATLARIVDGTPSNVVPIRA